MEIAILSESDHRRQVGARLRRMLDALDLTYTQAGEIMGTSKQTLNGWMKGEGYPNWYGIYRLNKAYRVTYDYLFLGDWSQLPAALADKVRPELLAALADQPEPDRGSRGTRKHVRS